MRKITISHLKACATRVIEEVANTQEPVIITKHGHPIARIIPHAEPMPTPGRLADTLVFERDIIAPLDEDTWGARG